MAKMFLQNNKIPKPTTSQFKLDDYSLGLNNVSSSYKMSLNESPNLLNTICFGDGSIETRPGSFKYILSQFATSIEAIFEYKTDSFTYILASSSTKLYKVDMATETVTELCSVSAVISGVQLDQVFLFVDGAKYRKYDGTNVYEIIQPDTLVGLAASGGATTVVLPSTASAVDDTYNNWIVYIKAGTGMGQSKTITDYVGATKTATVSAWTTQPDNTSQLYITKYAEGTTNTDGVNFKITYTPTYLEVADSYKGANNITSVLKCKQIIHHNNRLYYSRNSDNGNLIVYCDIGLTVGLNPYYVPSSQWLVNVTNDNEDILGIMSYNGVLAIFKSKTIHALYGFDYTDFDLKEVTVSCGTASFRSVVKADNYLIYLGANGVIYTLYDLRTDVKKIMVKAISEERINLVSDPISLNSSTWSTARAVYFKQYYILAISDLVLVYDKKGFHLWDTINPVTMFVRGNDLLYTSQTRYLCRLPFERFSITETFTAGAGQTEFTLLRSYIGEAGETVVKINNVVTTAAEQIDNTKFTLPACTGGETITIEHLSILTYLDIGVEYETYWESKDLDFDYITKNKQIKKAYIVANTYKYYTSNIHVDIYVDYDEYETDFVMENKISLFGISLFGDLFITKNIVESKPIAIPRRGKIFKFKLSGEGGDTPFKLYQLYGEIRIRM